MPGLHIFANLTYCSKRNPKVLFDAVNSLVSPASTDLPVFSDSYCSKSLSYFVDKENNALSSTGPLATLCVSDFTFPAKLESFSPVTSDRVSALISKMKASSNPPDVLPTSLLFFFISF